MNNNFLKCFKIFKAGAIFMLNFYLIIIYFLSGIIPKKKSLLIFGTWEGYKYCDNAKYLFLYVLKNHPELRPVWLTKSDKIIEQIRKDGYEAESVNSFKGFWLSCRAKYVFITHGLSADVNPYGTRNAFILDLFHATFPIKKMGYDNFSKLPLSRKIYDFLLAPFEFKKANYAFSPSDNVSRILNSALKIKKENIIVTGLPRTDLLLTKENIPEITAHLSKMSFKRLISYIPTFRDDANFSLFNFDYNESRLIDFLEKSDSLFLIRFHPFDSHKYVGMINKNNRILIDNSDDFYPLLKAADILITDYSSVCYDFLLLDRPIIFANFDHDNYIKERGFYFDYNEITPGPKAKNWNELISRLEFLMAPENDNFRAERSKMGDFIYKFIDTDGSRRIIEFVKKL